jgi:hypothetical protein
MYRIDDPTAAATLPTPEAALTEGYWTEGNPGSGIPATLERASWFNMIQEELRNVVLAGGLTPSKTTYTQLRDAINAYIGKGRLLRTSVYINNAGTLQVSIDGAAFVNASSTFTPLAATNAVELEGCGGGGGGGGALTTGASQSSAGSGGASGAPFKKKITSGFSGVAIQVGGAGSVSTGNAGTAGGTTSFGSIVSAPGGAGGPVGSAVSNTTSNFIGGTGTAVATGGDINGQSDSGKPGFISATPIGGAGGQSPYGGGAVISSGTSSGNTSNSYGAGGGGACLAANNAINAAGGLPLKSGVLIVKELS